MRALLTLLCLALAAPAGAQVFFGAEVGPDAFARAAEETNPDLLNDEAFAWAFSTELSSATLYAVFPSTAPEEEIGALLRRGVYRQELAAITLLAEERRLTAAKLAEDLRKEGGLAALARKHKADALALFRRAGDLKAAADARMPLFLPVTISTPAAASTPGVGR